MKYRLVWSVKAQKQFRRLDKSVQRYIDAWLIKNVDGSKNPRRSGKALSENLSGFYRYRIGDYRVICEIHDKICEVIAVSVGHRSKIYSD
jgi:mRNA interferase RelE/StbE